MGILKKLKFWRKRRDERGDVQKHIEELESTLQERDATLAAQEEEMKERNIRSEQVEATLRSRISELEEVEATLRGQIKGMEKNATGAMATKELDKLQESDADRQNVEDDPHRQIQELRNKLIDKEKVEADLRGNIVELQNKLHETDADKEKLNCQIKDLKKQIKEKESYRASLEFRLGYRITELEEDLQETDILKKEAESALRRQRKYYVKKQRERDALRDQVEADLYDRLKKLREKSAKDLEKCAKDLEKCAKDLKKSASDLGINKFYCQELRDVIRYLKEDLKKEALRYYELKKDYEVKYLQWKTVEAELRDEIKAQERIISETQKAAIEGERLTTRSTKSTKWYLPSWWKKGTSSNN
jgi:chromosome segregation ATPase